MIPRPPTTTRTDTPLPYTTLCLSGQLTGENASGTVKFFNAMKVFCFIQPDDGQPDAFVHIIAVELAGMAALNEGDRLDFELEVDRRGKYAAVNLQPKQD